MSRQAAGAAESSSVRRPSSPSTSGKSPSTSSSSSNDSFDVLVDEVLLDDPMEERIKATIMVHLFRGADPVAYRKVVAAGGAAGAEGGAAAETQAQSQSRRLTAYTDLLKTDVSRYTEAQAEEYRRELQRRSNECFGK